MVIFLSAKADMRFVLLIALTNERADFVVLSLTVDCSIPADRCWKKEAFQFCMLTKSSLSMDMENLTTCFCSVSFRCLMASLKLF